MVSLTPRSSLVSTPCPSPSISIAKHLPHWVWGMKGQISVQKRALKIGERNQ